MTSRSQKSIQRDYKNIQKKWGVSDEDMEYHKIEAGKKAGAIKKKNAATGHAAEAHEGSK